MIDLLKTCLEYSIATLQNRIKWESADNKPQRGYEVHKDNNVTEKEDRKKPKMNSAFQKLALEPENWRRGRRGKQKSN